MICTSCKREVDQTQTVFTTSGDLVCTPCSQLDLSIQQDARAMRSVQDRSRSRELGDMFGDATFNPHKRYAGVVVGILLIGAYIALRIFAGR